MTSLFKYYTEKRDSYDNNLIATLCFPRGIATQPYIIAKSAKKTNQFEKFFTEGKS